MDWIKIEEYVKAVYCHPAYLTYMQSTSCRMPDWMRQGGIKIAEKNIYFHFTDYAKAFDCGKFFKKWEYQITLPLSRETCMQVKKQQLEQEMEQWTGSKLGKEYVKAVYCHPLYLTYLFSTCEMLGWMNHKLASRLLGKYQQPQI